MEDDIDIEEHDVLDNPRIRHIFPYITSIKTEVEDYVEVEEEEPAIVIKEEPPSPPAPVVFECSNDVKNFNNKIILGTKPCASTSQNLGMVSQGTSLQGTEVQGTSLQGTEVQGTSFESQDFEGTFQETVSPETSVLKELLQKPTFQNKIILGSRTADSSDNESDPGDNEFDLPEVSVLLEDCRNFLESNPCFCKECQILFPTDNDLDSHKMYAHSFLVAVSKNIALKSTSKSFTNVDHKSLLCNHCNVVFPNTIALLRHTYELLPGKVACEKCDLVFDNDAACKAHMLKRHRNRSDLMGPKGTYAICKICSCHFKWIAKLKTHAETYHGTHKVGDVTHVLSNLHCHFCSSKMKNTKHYNRHILRFHSKKYYASFEDYEKISKFQCPQCNLRFSSDYSVRIHLAAKHGYLGNVEDSKKLANSQRTPVGSKKFANISKLPAKSQKNATQSITRTRPLPKCTLFKCNKCLMHFVSCISALIHSRSCVPTSKKGDYKCTQCRRNFKLQDKFYHDYQHSISERFKIIEISANIFNRVLCKCTKCGVCFDEKSFMTFHTESCNSEIPSIQCKQCNVRIHAKAMSVHKKIHASGLTFKDFIVTGYVHATVSLKEQEQTGLTAKFKAKTVKIMKTKRYRGAQIKRFDKKWCYYCPTCECYMRMNKYTDKHCIGQCNVDVQTVTCKSCGLRFTHKGFQNHLKVHKLFPKLKLKDLKFMNIQTGSSMCPPFPDFKKCNQCKVTFFGDGALNNHGCNSEKSKICAYCKAKFSDLAYKIHVPYHEYAATFDINEEKIANEANNKTSEINENIPELIKKYESLKQVWNILYLCYACDLVIDSYDKVVEHCQDHFCNMQSYNVTVEHCRICDLNFVDECFKRHEKLHLNGDTDKDSFIILGYKYENLLSDDAWMDMFNSLTKDQIQLILSKSMYRFTRCVRMRVVSEGSFDLTLYQCGECDVIVAPNRVMEHSQNVNGTCESTKKHSCSMCPLKFAYKSHKIVHENLHEIRAVGADSFRIVQFHADKQFSYTEVKQNELDEVNVMKNVQRKDPEGLKFIRCQHCGKLINKNKYKVHLTYHYYYNKKNKSSKANAQKIHNFYVCRDCKVCVAKESVNMHVCDVESKKRKCDKCSLLFRSQNLAAHHSTHERNNITRSNMKIMYFEGEVIDKKPRRPYVESKVPAKQQTFTSKVTTLYQCSRCNLCIWNKVNVSKHTCSPESRRFKCDTCGLVLLISRQMAHKEMHRTRHFNTANVRLIKFSHKNTSKPNRSTNPVPHKRKIQTVYEETVAKRPKIENNSSVADFVTQATNRYYKCKTCKLLFVGFNDLIEHESSCETDREAAKCKDCGLVFHTDMIEKHIKLQFCKYHTKRNVYIHTVQRKGKSHNIESNWLYLCLNCDTHNISTKGIHYHLKTNHQSKNAIKTCEQCNIKFTSTSYINHLKLHHGELETDISDLSIAAVEDTTLVNALKDLPKDDDVVYVDSDKLRTPKNSIGNGQTQPGIYTCDVCGLNFINPNSLIKHKYIGTHNRSDIRCKLCGLMFTIPSLKKHMEIHHKNEENESASEMLDNNRSSPDGEESDSAESSADLREDKNDRDALLTSHHNALDDDAIDETDITDPSKESGAKTAENPPRIHSCDVCHMSFLHEGSLIRHRRVGKHNEARHECKECGLIFSYISIKRHMSIHHGRDGTGNKLNLNASKKSKADLNDSIVESVSRIFEPNTSSTPDKNNINNGNSSKTRVETVARNINNNPSTSEERNISDKSNINNFRNVENLDTVRNIDAVASGSLETRNANEFNTARTELNKNKLYKCSLCNVYFLTSGDCSDHTTNHTQLDTFEYIACKICGLQFCCEFLGRHMRSHREMTFSVDDLIVAEYHPSSSGEVKVDTYLFMDSLVDKDKLVTTTTHFDTENVDSTTESASVDDAS